MSRLNLLNREPSAFVLQAVLIVLSSLSLTQATHADELKCSEKLNADLVNSSPGLVLPNGGKAKSGTSTKDYFRCCQGKPSSDPANSKQWCNSGFTESSGLKRGFYTDELTAKKVDPSFYSGSACDPGFDLYTCWPRFREYKPINVNSNVQNCSYIDSRPLLQPWSEKFENSFGGYDVDRSKLSGATRVSYPIKCEGKDQTICFSRLHCQVSKDAGNGLPPIDFWADITATCLADANGGCDRSAMECAKDSSVSPSRGSDLSITTPGILTDSKSESGN